MALTVQYVINRDHFMIMVPCGSYANRLLLCLLCEFAQIRSEDVCGKGSSTRVFDWPGLVVGL